MPTASEFWNINKIVFHANYSADIEAKSSWLNKQSSFWKLFLQDKAPSSKIYIENLANETPELLAQLCDDVWSGSGAVWKKAKSHPLAFFHGCRYFLQSDLW